MRISIWQQFSSNHSGGFNLIAEFKSLEDLEKARTVTNHFIETIAEWYKQHPELDEELREHGLLPLTPAEEKLAEQYKLNNWEFSVDWAPVEANTQVANRGFYIFRNLLFLTSPIETWVDTQPFNELLERQGAHIIWQFYGDSDDNNAAPVVNLVCTAPDEMTAARIVQSLHATETYKSGDTDPRIRISDSHTPYNGHISHQGARIECREIETHSFGGKEYNWKSMHISEFLRDLTAYLETQGCTNFELSISEKPEET